MKLENLLFILLYLFYYNRLLFIVFLGCPRIRVLFFLCRSRTGYSTPIRTGTRTRTRTGSTFCSIFFLSLFFSLRNQNTENRKQIITQHLAIDLSSLSFPFLQILLQTLSLIQSFAVFSVDRSFSHSFPPLLFLM